MAKFVPSEHVERLEYDFTEYGGSTGVIPEPSTGRVNGFFRDMKSMMREVSALQSLVKDLDVEEMSEEDMVAKMSQVEEAEAVGSEFQQRSMENLAILCGATRNDDGTIEGGTPGVAEFELLPYRVLQAFSTWLMGEIRPKKETPGTKR